jgi:single-strand DNA-binding protein
MRSRNRVELIGNITFNPELKHLDGGKTVCTFGMATNRNWTSGDGEKKEDTDYHKIVAWGKLAEICNSYLTKGRYILVEGRLHSYSFTDKDGISRAAIEIVADDMIMLDAKKPEAHSEGVTQPEAQQQAATTV